MSSQLHYYGNQLCSNNMSHVKSIYGYLCIRYVNGFALKFHWNSVSTEVFVSPQNKNVIDLEWILLLYLMLPLNLIFVLLWLTGYLQIIHYVRLAWLYSISDKSNILVWVFVLSTAKKEQKYRTLFLTHLTNFTSSTNCLFKSLSCKITMTVKW